MPRTRRGHGLMFRRIARTHRQDLFPVLPVAIGDLHGNRRADGVPMPHAGKDVRRIRLDAHAAAAAIALLATP